MGIYDELGVRPLINARGTISAIGGSLPHAEVLAAMVEAGQQFANTYELQEAAGGRLAHLTRNEAAFVSLGAAGGLLMAAAAVMAGHDEEKRARLPDTTGMKHEAVALAVNPSWYHRCVYPAGMRVRWVGDPQHPTGEELRQAIGPDTACCLYFVDPELEGQLPLAVVSRTCHDAGIPVIVDAAAQIPPFANTWRFTREQGADLAIFSGGKGLRGPQSSGLMVGSRDLIDKVRHFCPPRHTVARPAKVSRELIAGLVRAVEIAAAQEDGAVIRAIEGRLERLQAALASRRDLKVERRFGTDVGKPFHHLRVRVDGDARLTAKDLVMALDAGEPRIAVGGPSREGVITLNAEMLQDGEEVTVARQIAALLDGKG